MSSGAIYSGVSVMSIRPTRRISRRTPSCACLSAGRNLMRSRRRVWSTVARNQVIDFLRHHAHIRKAQEYFALHGQRHASVTEEQVVADELERIEADCIKRMPAKMAEVFVLYVHRGWSVPDISDSLDISRRTVENHIFRARCDVRRTVKTQYS